MDENIIVYVKVDSNNMIIDINSSIFISDITGWIKVDEGNTDKYTHAQSNYLDEGLMSVDGKYNYKLVDNKPVELTDDEKKKLFPDPIVPETLEEQINSLKESNANILFTLMNGVLL